MMKDLRMDFVGGEEFALGEAGVEDEGGFGAGGIEFVEEGAAECGFAAADFAGEDDEAFFLAEAIAQVCQGILMRRAQIKKAGVWGDVKRHHVEPVKLLIHGASRRE